MLYNVVKYFYIVKILNSLFNKNVIFLYLCMSFHLFLIIPDFNVTLNVSSTKVQKWKDVTVICAHNLPRTNISIRWIVNQNLMEGDHNETFQILEMTERKEITCNISSICGNFSSTETITVEGHVMYSHLCPQIYTNIKESKHYSHIFMMFLCCSQIQMTWWLY